MADLVKYQDEARNYLNSLNLLKTMQNDTKNIKMNKINASFEEYIKVETFTIF